LTDDVPPADDAKSFHQSMTDNYYRIPLGIAFAFQRYVAGVVGVMALMVGLMPLPLLRIAPTGKVDDDTRKMMLGVPNVFHTIYMCYTYFNWIRRDTKKSVTIEDSTLPRDVSKVPVLYMYGTEKAANFHTEQSLTVLRREQDRQRSKTRVVAVDGAGHYLYLQKPDVCFDCVTQFMQGDQ